TMPNVAQIYALPQDARDAGAHHWGYHGISYDYISRQLPKYAPAARRVIAAHLGGGTSMCAMLDGHSVETTMGFAGGSGLPMGTRSGDVPIDVLFYLLRSKKFDDTSLEKMLYERSGLLGLSGISGDMRELEGSKDSRAAAAIDYFVYAMTKFAGAYTAVLGGLDAFVFTAGIGEHARSGTHQAMNLLTALGAALRYDKTSGTEIETAWTTALAIAEMLDDADYHVRAISGLRTIRLTEGTLREVLALARRFKEVAARATDRRDVLVGDRMIGFALYLLGEQADARRHIETMLRRYVTSVHRLHIIRFGYDQRVIADNTLASILWLQGFPDQAVRIAERNIEDALSLDHELLLCNALGQCACRIALLVGDLAAAERYVAMLLDHSARHSLPAWHASGRCFDGILRIKQGDVGGGLNVLRTGLDELSETRFETRYLALLAQLAEASSRV